MKYEDETPIATPIERNSNVRGSCEKDIPPGALV